METWKWPFLAWTNSRLPLSRRDSDRWCYATRTLPQDYYSIGWRSWPEAPFWKAWPDLDHEGCGDAFGITSELFAARANCWNGQQQTQTQSENRFEAPRSRTDRKSLGIAK